MLNKNSKGITLLSLVITIVVLLILAGVSITAITDDSGIWNKSNEISKNSNTALEKNSEQINNIIKELDEIINPWIQNKTVVTKKTKNGIKTLNVGDDYTYNCGVEGYTGGWKVLGAENGKLLIMSTANIGTLSLCGKDGSGTTDYPAGYLNGIDKLNEMCAPYGTSARSIKVEDINRVTGYDPTNQGDGTVFMAGTSMEYGIKVTYTASGCTATNGQTYTGSISFEHPDGRKIGTDDVTSITVKNTVYGYYPNTLTLSSSGTTVGITTDSSAYEMLFGKESDTSNSNGNVYWLASSCVSSSSYYCTFDMRMVTSNGVIATCSLWYATASSDKEPRLISPSSIGVRAVVPVE